MKIITYIFILLLTGCTIVPYEVSNRTCKLVGEAVSGSSGLDSLWYRDASAVLGRCGDRVNKLRADYIACYIDNMTKLDDCKVSN